MSPTLPKKASYPDNLTEAIDGEIGCACSIDEDPRPRMMLIRTDRPLDGSWPWVEFDLREFITESFVEHLGEYVEIRFYKDRPEGK